MFEFIQKLSRKRGEYNINGREIIIRNISEIRNTRFIERAIISTIKNVKIAEKFSKITFYLGAPGKGIIHSEETATIDTRRLRYGLVDIHINTNVFLKLKNDKQNLKELMWETLTHELTHVWHEHVSKIFQKMEKQCSRTLIAMRKRIPDIVEHKPNLKEIRIWLSDFLTRLLMEGLAQHCVYIQLDGFSFRTTVFAKLYVKAVEKAKQVQEMFLNYLSAESSNSETADKKLNSLINLLVDASYDIGQHMVYSILFIDHDMTIEKIAKLSPHKFIKKYETVMKIKGRQPVVSLTSGDGILDYRKMVAEWWVVVKKHQ